MTSVPSYDTNPLDVSLGLSSKGTPQDNCVIWKLAGGIPHQIDYKSRSTVGWINRLLAMITRFQGVSVKISDNEIAVFKKKDLKKIGLRGTLDQRAQKVVAHIKNARTAVVEGLSGPPPTKSKKSKTSAVSPDRPKKIEDKIANLPESVLAIDAVIRGLCDENPKTRMTAGQAREALNKILSTL